MAREKVMQLLVSCSSSDISWEEIFPHIVFRNFSFLEHEAEPHKLLTTEEINELESDTRIHWEESELDLVEIAPTAEPPVARVMDYGKFKYQEAKKAHEAKLKQKVIQVKEVKFRPGTDDGDYNVKLRNLTRFLEEGDKTKITLRFRGRELAHQEIGVRMLERLKADLEPYGAVEQFPKMEGRQMVMVLSPIKKK